MTWDSIESNWKLFAAQARVHWSDLSDSDLAGIEGKRDQLAGLIQQRYGIAKDEADREVDAWADVLKEDKRLEEPASAGRFF